MSSSKQSPVLTMNDGHTIPQLGIGVWQVPEPDSDAVLAKALEVGYRHIDTAQAYENETGVGRALAATEIPRGKIFVTSKLRNKNQGYDNALRTFDQSMQRLGLDTLDLFLIHWPYPEADLYLETWKALIELRDSGRVRSIGVSNFQRLHLERIIGETGVTPAINQIELHPEFQQRSLRAFHSETGILTQSWSPLGRGQTFEHATIQSIASAHGKSPAQVILRWQLDSGLITFPKSVTPARIEENFQIFDFELSADDMDRIGQIDSPSGRFGPVPDELNVAF